MKLNHIVAFSIATLLFGLSGSARATESEAGPGEAEPTDGEAAATVEVAVTLADVPDCGLICTLDALPIYVPPSRGRVATRIGGGSRGG